MRCILWHILYYYICRALNNIVYPGWGINTRVSRVGYRTSYKITAQCPHLRFDRVKSIAKKANSKMTDRIED